MAHHTMTTCIKCHGPIDLDMEGLIEVCLACEYGLTEEAHSEATTEGRKDREAEQRQASEDMNRKCVLCGSPMGGEDGLAHEVCAEQEMADQCQADEAVREWDESRERGHASYRPGHSAGVPF